MFGYGCVVFGKLFQWSQFFLSFVTQWIWKMSHWPSAPILPSLFSSPAETNFLVSASLRVRAPGTNRCKKNLQTHNQKIWHWNTNTKLYHKNNIYKKTFSMLDHVDVNEVWPVVKRTSLWIQAAEMSFLSRVFGLALVQMGLD